ncbi:glycosyltransferase family 4 protein [Pseudarthrobacter phenanthrenivorans]|uniref:glycosyltransferase family 4 protein n=1 Tax=Pseudarthrobacter phenanthrenivorans TaxID=361575 RepID=UPI00142F8512|nr:glycosyltransferase family 4 protein [Pseudarthrobacter phenanthrenivorans]
MPAANVYAGYEDKTSATESTSPSSFWLPTPINAASRNGAIRSNSQVRRVGFIGNFLYPPNVMSLREFFAGYGAALAARGIEIVVAGFGSDIVETWNVQATVLGKVDSLTNFYESIDAAIVPVDHGGGIKAKAVEAMAHGVPVFGTDHVVSGFAPVWGKYIGRIDELLKETPTLPPVVPAEIFHQEFSQQAFSTAVSAVLDRL